MPTPARQNNNYRPFSAVFWACKNKMFDGTCGGIRNVPVELRESPGCGRGLFATEDIKSQTVVESSPVIVLPTSEWEAHGRHTIMNHYAFVWRDSKPPSMALALGLGSIFNHNNDPNVGWICDFHTRTIRYITLRDVKKGEELCISYGRELWFEDAHHYEDGEEDL